MNVKAIRSIKSSTNLSMSSTHKNYRQIQDDERFSQDPSNPIKLYSGEVIDTTDRSMLQLSRTVKFDPTGFKFDRPLQKDIFHTDPYITCSNCNFLSFVDVVTVRRMLSLPAAVSAELRLAPELLPPCVVCHSADCFVVGSHDFSAEVEERQRRALEKLRIETEAATRLQKCYRRYLRRMYGSALCDTFLANKYLRYVAALKITSAARGRLGRRIAHTERALVVIKHSHPLLIRHSLRSTLRGPKVFWYKRQVEIDLLYANYLELVKKTGFTPPRKLVENNIAEIARRVLARQNQLIVLVQRRWRGFMARRIVRYFRTEISRLFQFRVARVMKIQRVYRGHAVRLSIPRLIAEWERRTTMDDYLLGAQDEQLHRTRYKAAEQVMGFYRTERSEEKTARYTSRVAAAHHCGNRKMAAFWESPYADDRLGQQTDKLLGIEYGQIRREKDAWTAQMDRRVFMENRIAEPGPTGFGLRSVPMMCPPSGFYYDSVPSAEDLGLDVEASAGINISASFLASVAATVDTLSSARSSRSRSFRIYFQNELSHIAQMVVERAQHDFSKPGLALRFRSFNEERLQRLRQVLKYDAKQQAQALAASIAAVQGIPTGRTIKAESPLRAKQLRKSLAAAAVTNAATPEAAVPVGNGETAGPANPSLKSISVSASSSKSSKTEKSFSSTKGKKLEGSAGRKDQHLRGNFKYPEHIYFNAMEWLYEDYDV